MSESRDSLFAGLAAQFGRLRRDLGEMLAARLELAQLEATEAARQTARCGIVLAVALLLLLSSLPVAVVTLALAVATYLEQSPIAWLAGSALLLVAVAALSTWLAVRHYRRNFSGLRDTLAELREDLVWLREWSGQADQAAAPASDTGSDPLR